MIEALRRWLGRPRQPVIRSRQLLDWLEEASQGFLLLDRANRLSRRLEHGLDFRELGLHLALALRHLHLLLSQLLLQMLDLAAPLHGALSCIAPG